MSESESKPEVVGGGGPRVRPQWPSDLAERTAKQIAGLVDAPPFADLESLAVERILDAAFEEVVAQLADLRGDRDHLQQQNHDLLLKLAVIHHGAPKDVQAWAQRMAHDAEHADRVEQLEADLAQLRSRGQALVQQLVELFQTELLNGSTSR